MKYHLGCGSTYLEGYTNVDLPPSEHIVKPINADLYTDLLKLAYQPCDEIRCHHVFEHFNYTNSLYLIRVWTIALNKGGLLWIEVPDVEALSLALVNSDSMEKSFKIIRYLYGSHESGWAYHINGWTPSMLINVLTNIGYICIDAWRCGDAYSKQPNCSFNIKCTLLDKLNPSEIDKTLKNIIKLYKNDDSEFENNLCKYHQDVYDKMLFVE
jgi:hypothetical protein